MTEAPTSKDAEVNALNHSEQGFGLIQDERVTEPKNHIGIGVITETHHASCPKAVHEATPHLALHSRFFLILSPADAMS